MRGHKVKEAEERAKYLSCYDCKMHNLRTVNWAQISNEYRAKEQAGDRAEWKFES